MKIQRTKIHPLSEVEVINKSRLFSGFCYFWIMKHFTRFARIWLLLLIFLISCQEEHSSPEQEKVVRPGTPLDYFEQLLERKDPQEIIDLANKGLAAAESVQDSSLLKILSYKVYYHNRLRQYDSSLVYADSLYSLSQLQKDTLYIGDGLYRKFAIYNYYLNDARKAYKYAHEGLKLYLKQGDSLRAAERMINMASVQRRVGDYSGSYESATEALKFLLPGRDSSRISQAYTYLGLAYRAQGFSEEAAREYENAIPYAQKKQEKFSLRNNLAMVKLDLKKYDAAIRDLEQLYAEVDTSDLEELALRTNNLAYARWKKDPDSDVEDDFLKAYQIRLDIEDKFGLMDSYAWLFDYYQDKRPERARELALKHLELARETGRVNSEISVLRDLIAISPPEEVGEFSRQFVKLNDSVSEARLRDQNAFAKIRFDEENKQREILNLEAENTLQELETQRWRNRNYIALLLGMLLLVSILFFIYVLRQRYKREKIREVHMTESRISKRIHDELANDVYNVMSSLEAVAPTETVDKLEYIYKRTRDISRENSEIETGKEFSAALLSMLTNTTGRARLILKGESAVNWERLSEEKKIVIYRVLQELMVNMKKHSQAKLVALTFSESSKYLEIKYSDIGVGVNPEQLREGNGLQNLQNRLKSVDGSVSFKTSEGKGFKVELKIPK